MMPRALQLTWRNPWPGDVLGVTGACRSSFDNAT
jgi:hypothetical protein